jgi:hypothetical protein
MTLRQGESRALRSAPAIAGCARPISVYGSGTLPLLTVAHMPFYPYPFPVMAKQKLPPKEREERRKNWLAPAGSLQERRMLEKLARQQELAANDRALVYAYLSKPDGFAERNALFWHAAKKQVLGPIIYDMALERQKNLSPDEWLVACLITQGFKQKEEIAPIIGKSLPTVEKTVASIKHIIMHDLSYDIEAVTLAQITRWFLGL